MLRKIAAGTSAALIAIGLAVAPAVGDRAAPRDGRGLFRIAQSPLPDIAAAHRNSSAPPSGRHPDPRDAEQSALRSRGRAAGSGRPGPPSAPPVETAVHRPALM